jgi:hypothetical protein
MCPPPADPLWPVGPPSGNAWLDRTQRIRRVGRRHANPDDEGGGHGGHHHHDEPEDELGARWLLRSGEAGDLLGAYDDHGRIVHAPDEPDELPHLDATA